MEVTIFVYYMYTYCVSPWATVSGNLWPACQIEPSNLSKPPKAAKFEVEILESIGLLTPNKMVS